MPFGDTVGQPNRELGRGINGPERGRELLYKGILEGIDIARDIELTALLGSRCSVMCV